MENLLEMDGRRFEAYYTGLNGHGHDIKGEVLVTTRRNDTYAELRFDYLKMWVGNGSSAMLEKMGITNFRLLEPGEPESKEKKHDASKHNEAKEPAYPAEYNQADKESIRRETATQLLAGMLASGYENSGNQALGIMVIDAVMLTDELLKKLGE